MKCWTAAEVKAFLAATRESREYPLWRLLACAGLRRGEAVGLRWDDVQFIPPADDDEGAELGRLSIRHTLVSVGYQVQESEPKTARGRRTVPLDATTVAALREQAARQADDAAEWGETWTDTGYVFTRESGQPMHPDRVTKLFDAAVEAAKVPRIRLHDLRHTVATRMLEAGVPVKVVSEILGHSSVAFTMDRYSHVIPSMQESAVTMLADLYK